MACGLFKLPTVLLFSSISFKKQTSKQQTTKGSNNSPKVDLVEVNARLTYLSHTTLKGPLDLFSLNVHIKLVWLNELLHGVAQ